MVVNEKRNLFGELVCGGMINLMIEYTCETLIDNPLHFFLFPRTHTQHTCIHMVQRRLVKKEREGRRKLTKTQDEHALNVTYKTQRDTVKIYKAQLNSVHRKKMHRSKITFKWKMSFHVSPPKKIKALLSYISSA